MNTISKELNTLLQKQREASVSHIDVEDEYKMYRMVQNGEFEDLSQVPDLTLPAGVGVLSKNALKNEIYHAIVLITLLTRFCVEGGLDSEIAYLSSDIYIQRIDVANSIDEITELKRSALLHFSLEMRKLHTTSFSPHVSKAKDFIEAHITERLNNRDIANKLGLHENYLSQLFKQETGMTLSNYVCTRKCQVAKYMLENGNASCTDISAFLSFSSCSHFIVRFKEIVGVTPNEYRKNSFRKGLSKN